MSGNARSQLQIGWVGVGRMGLAMAHRLAAAGLDLTAFNRSPEKAQPLRAYGAKIAATLADLGACDVIFVMVSTDEAVEEVVAGPRGLLAQAHDRLRLVIDCSSISVDMSAGLRKVLARAGVAFLAAPVSGNPHVVEAGQASFVASGPKASFDEIEPLLLLIGHAATYVGEGELARIAKICHNVWLGALTQALAEVLVLAQKAGMTRTAFLDFINRSALGSPYTRVKTPQWRALDFSATFTAPLMRKDMDLGLALADRMDAPMPLSTLTREIILSQINQGFVDVDFSTLLLLQARSAGLEMKPEIER
ncbi:MAG TPA: NAD(P)-dependent oxidoreductase [Roseiarcus sp.]|jgi:3-hydroxyisobutyrate dehydrogenase-like beta-hydroxyacid dehydrogenase